jgi:hypothetical protein
MRQHAMEVARSEGDDHIREAEKHTGLGVQSVATTLRRDGKLGIGRCLNDRA